MRSALSARLRDERGIALILAIGVLGALSVAAAATVAYTSANTRNAEISTDSARAYVLAEAGVAEAMAVLSNPSNNALNAALLPGQSSPKVSSYEGGTVSWYGTFDSAQQRWSVTSVGTIDNPSGDASDVRRTLTTTTQITPTLTQPLNNPSWNYIFVTQTDESCDVTFSNNVGGSTRLYVMGDLCLSNNVQVLSSPLVVKGKLILSNNAQVGESTSMSTRVEAYVGAGCQYGNQHDHSTAQGDGHAFCSDVDHVYSKKDTPSVIGVSNSPPELTPPSPAWDSWYANAIPGPAQTCTSTNGAVSGTVPNGTAGWATAFDNDTLRNNSLGDAYVFNLTPSSSYTCRVGPENCQSCSPPTTPTGELSWNASTRVLTVSGTIYIDGSMKITNGYLNQYNGQATIYLSGTLLLNNNTKLCGGVSGSDCAFSTWDPNTEMLVFVADATGGQAGTGNSILLDNNVSLQGGLYATGDITLTNNAKTDGPMVGNTVVVDNNVELSSFPAITTIPVGAPGVQTVYAEPQAPAYAG